MPSLSSRPNWREWGKERKKERTQTYLLRVGGYHQLSNGHSQIQWMTGPSRNTALIPAPKAPEKNPLRAHCPKKAPPPWRVTKHEVDNIWEKMDRADGSVGITLLGTCVRNVGSPVSCLLPEPSIQFSAELCPQGTHTVASRKEV